MARKFTLILALVGLLGLATAPAVAAARPGTGGITQQVTGTVAGLGDFTGTITLNRVTTEAGQLVGSGTIVGAVTDPVTGDVVQNINTAFTSVLDVAGASCEILDLVLGPLNLDLLGLVVQLDTVHLNITAEQGPGNLLGNLLCSVAGLLDGGLNLNGLNGLATLLNQILSILG